MTDPNPYLEKHVYVHYIEQRKNNGTEAVLIDRTEEIRFTQTGIQKYQELNQLFPKTHRVPKWLVPAFGALFLLTIILGLITFYPLTESPINLYIGLFLTGCTLYSTCSVLVKRFTGPTSDDRRAAALITRFAAENPDFIEAMSQVDKTIAVKCHHFIRLYQ